MSIDGADRLSRVSPSQTLSRDEETYNGVEATIYHQTDELLGLATKSHARLDQPTSRHKPHVNLRLAQKLAQNEPVVAPAGNRTFGYLAAKRAIDIIGSLVLLVLLSPVLLITTLVLLVTTRGKPFYGQTRVGDCGKQFFMLKFRTMVPNADQNQHLISNDKDGPIFKNRRDPRITRIGAILRSTSIDELPQLFHVLLGQMSLVGPRPPVPKEVVEYAAWQLGRLAVKPGLTCLWQVSGRSDIGFEKWVRMDLWYIRHQRLSLDLWLIVKTPWCVITRRGAY